MKIQNSIPRVSVSGWFVFALVALLLSGCERAGSQPPNGMPPPEVSVVTIEPKNIPATFEYTGQTAGSREVEVRARVTGILLKRNYSEGGTVTQGQSLFTIDPALYNAAFKRSEADLGAVQARFQQSHREVLRLKPLFKAKAISQKEYDDAVSNEAIAAADVKAARARVTEARLNLEYTQVESPISGIAGRGLRSEGNYVTGPDVLLTTVTQIDPMYVLFGISDEERLKLHRESEAGRLILPKDGNFDVNVKLAEGGLYPKSGKMNFTGVRVSGTTGTSEARAELPNPNGLLRPGTFVRVILGGAQRPNAILVPQRAVLEGPQGKFVYIVNAENKAEARPVQLGDWQDDDWIITAGVNAGDKVIVDGVMKIGPGAPVRIADPNSAKAPPGKPGDKPPASKPATK
ncbi:MAG: efflux RND transporter periplasmic adaptor subunit [Sulfuricaulis sp.]|uniref:efflux RND transporter periplasmic adaptor subunit n=1 Tax=Sulfuricaulis sp. TaxID=2003553 RepID=UPI0025F8F3B3|nr:efflux RND transporter periplasmic adaptor subunit [Sulfuricaulis sp.]MCR4346468.1 efflux RND transporter periplasmic adaptor subunit [Sulfuricaulis sp.]